MELNETSSDHNLTLGRTQINVPNVKPTYPIVVEIFYSGPKR